jgi:hypothetical protein
MHGKSIQSLLENFIERGYASDLDVDGGSMLKMYCRE